jgi:predicted nucleic acid-binding protein
VVADKYKRPCLDSAIFIGGLVGEIAKDIKRDVVFDFLWQEAKAGKFKVFISALALAEVYKKKSAIKPGDAVLDEFLVYINEPFVEVIEVDREVGIQAHSLCRRYASARLFPNDAIHLACALRAECDFLLTWDTPLLDVTHPDILIEEPVIYSKTLFTVSEIATPEEIKAYSEKQAAELAARNALALSIGALKRHEFADKIADKVVLLSRSGSLPETFTTKQVRESLSGEFKASQLDGILPGYCADGEQVKRGRQARFKKVSRGKYSCL